MSDQEKLQKLKLKYLLLVQKSLEAQAECDRINSQVRPGIFASEMYEPGNVTGLDVTSDTKRYVEELAKVHPALKAQMDTLFSDAVLEQCAKDYDVLLEQSRKDYAKASDVARDVREQLDWAFDTYERAGGAVYDSRINPQVLDEGLARNAIRFNDDLNDDGERYLVILKKAMTNLDLSTLQERLRHAGLKDWTLIEATDQHPAQVACNRSVSSAVQKEVRHFAAEGLRAQLHMIQDQKDQISWPEKEALVDIIQNGSPLTSRIPFESSFFSNYSADRYRALSEEYETEWNPENRLSPDTQPLLEDLGSRITAVRQQLLSNGATLRL